MTVALPLVLLYFYVIALSFGMLRNNQLSPGPTLKLNTGLLQLPHLKYFGYECFSKNLKCF
jgi:hypothetical protein